MGLKGCMLFLLTALLWGGCSNEGPTGRTIRLEGPEAEIPPITQEVTELHLRAVGADRVYALHLPATLRALNLSNNNLIALPDDLVPQGIARLWLADNKLTTLPRAAETWQQLTYLNLDRNLISALPDLSHTALRWLRLNANRLSDLPPLPQSLERLYLADNRLTAPPPKPRALKQLVLAGNPLQRLPDDLGAGLEWLDLSRTPITTLPRDLTAWRTLRVLNLSRCPLSEAEKDRLEAAFDPLETTLLF